MKSLCVFCGANAGNKPVYRATAENLGRLLAGRGIQLIYGGGNVGLMGAVADACLDAGGTVIGVIPQALMGKEVEGRPVDHRTLTRLEVVDSMHTRKARMAELAEGFIAMPGGFGTFEEYCEILTWAQLGFHVKPIG
ncbi:MAG TPA: TIGR00730 family Rossman fold protein, partial [Azonexus sp.]|nr:TIGR00730 family Rossman fold protein [Azonexus sp.]